MKVLVVVDMQVDFVSGALGTPQAQAIVPIVVQKIEEAKENGWTVVFTKDTHGENYLETAEGRKLPVVHCIRETPGWELVPELRPLAKGLTVIEKPTFGSFVLAQSLKQQRPECVELIGLCTDICVISNAMLLKAAMPEVPISVDAACCAGVTHESHETALAAMRACQIDVVGW